MDRVKTGTIGLDEMMHGGLLPQTATIVEGAPGTGKTTLGMQFIHHGIVHENEPGIILTFEQFPAQYYRDAANFGWDFRKLEEEGKLRIMMSSPEVSRAYLEEAGGQIEEIAREMGARRIVVDSLSQFERLAEDPLELRQTIYSFMNGLKREGLTAIFTWESMTLLGGVEQHKTTIPFVADTYILLRYVEMESAMHKALLVLKMRGSDHDKDIRQFTITSQGIQVQSRFEGREGIMSGSPHQMTDSFMRAFVKR